MAEERRMEVMFWLSCYDVWPLPNHCLLSHVQSLWKWQAWQNEADRLASDTLRLQQDSCNAPSVQLFLMPHHCRPWRSPLISWQFNIKKYKLIISTGSACLLLCNANRGSTLNADGVQAEPLSLLPSTWAAWQQGCREQFPRPNYTEWVIILALGIMFQWQWRSCWFNAIRQVRLRGSRARLCFWEFHLTQQWWGKATTEVS